LLLYSFISLNAGVAVVFISIRPSFQDVFS
jgi:hypothetical protein